MYIYLQFCHCLFLRSNLNNNFYDVVLEYLTKIEPLNIEWMHSIWYVRYTIGVHKITVTLTAPDIYEVGR